ncbi:hypothetical protein ARMSODRAFT_527253 [Armillaria solidipes]|uniref:Uncharacterized protein n=1 Tax=Armillaria solidipes TaxID=1076256 RepID=A0A2H3BIY2_9AGAR|nr:hypothetical protein ARMSODRAFT_527253 [Armillaria solidipes]
MMHWHRKFCYTFCSMLLREGMSVCDSLARVGDTPTLVKLLRGRHPFPSEALVRGYVHSLLLELERRIQAKEEGRLVREGKIASLYKVCISQPKKLDEVDHQVAIRT